METQRRCARCDLWVWLGEDAVACGACLNLVGLMPATLRRRHRDMEWLACRSDNTHPASAWAECHRIDCELRRRELTLAEPARAA